MKYFMSTVQFNSSPGASPSLAQLRFFTYNVTTVYIGCCDIYRFDKELVHIVHIINCFLPNLRTNWDFEWTYQEILIMESWSTELFKNLQRTELEFNLVNTIVEFSTSKIFKLHFKNLIFFKSTLPKICPNPRKNLNPIFFY